MERGINPAATDIDYAIHISAKKRECRQITALYSLFLKHVGRLQPRIVTVLLFLPARRYASAGLCDTDVSVCLSVCLSGRPSHAGIVPSRAKAGS